MENNQTKDIQEGIIEGNKLIDALAAKGYVVKPNGEVWIERKLKLSVGNAGYPMVNIFGCGDGKYKTHSVHRLVAMKFLPNPDGLAEVNHKDGNKLNNSVENLEWVSRSQNIQHGYDTGLITPPWKGKKGSKHPKSQQHHNKNK